MNRSRQSVFLDAARAVRFLLPAIALIVSPRVESSAPEPELVERLPGAIDDHTVVLLDDGRAVVAWERDDSREHETVWTSRRITPGRWSVPEIVEYAQGHASGVRLAAGDAGTVTVIWLQQELRVVGLWSNRYLPREGWREPVRVEPEAGELFSPQLALDDNGRGFAVWERRLDEELRLRASRFTPEHGWEAPRGINLGEGELDIPQLDVNARGSAIVAAPLRFREGSWRISTSRYIPGAGWVWPDEISSGNEDAYNVQVGMDTDGNAFATWEQGTRGDETVLASRFEPGKGWSTPARLDMERGEVDELRLAVSADGDAMVAWIRADGETGIIIAAHYERGRGWGDTVTVHGGELLFVFDLDLAANTSGDVLATWSQTDGSRNNVWYARFDARATWRQPTLAEHRTGSAHQPRAVAGPDGAFGLIWKTVDAPLPDHALYSLWFRLVP